MAELLLKVGDSLQLNNYFDQDILCAFTDKHISKAWFQNIVSDERRKIGFKSNGLRDTNSLLFSYMNEISIYRFERQNETESLRVNLTTGETQVISDKTVPHSYVDEFIKRRLKSKNHLIFGEIGKEIYFDKTVNFSEEKANNVWSHITAKTGKLKEDHTLWPLGTAEPYDSLPLGLDADLTDNEAIELVKPITELQDGKEVIIKKREKFIPWQEIDTISPLSIAKINNVNTPVDKRVEYPITLSKELQVKNG